MTKTLDRVRAAAQKLVGKIAEAAEKYAEASDELTDGGKLTHSDVARHHLEMVSNEVGKGTQHARSGDEDRSKRRDDEGEIKLREAPRPGGHLIDRQDARWRKVSLLSVAIKA